jgi:hypothetical protein
MHQQSKQSSGHTAAIGRNQNIPQPCPFDTLGVLGLAEYLKVSPQRHKDTKSRPNTGYLYRVGRSARMPLSLVFFVSLW